jgi:hypothetical protein
LIDGIVIMAAGKAGRRRKRYKNCTFSGTSDRIKNDTINALKNVKRRIYP